MLGSYHLIFALVKGELIKGMSFFFREWRGREV